MADIGIGSDLIVLLLTNTNLNLVKSKALGIN